MRTSSLNTMKFILTIMAVVSADLIGYNRNVNNNYQHKSIQLKEKNLEQLSKHGLGEEGHYRATVAMFMLQQGHVKDAAKLLNQLNMPINNKRASNKNRQMRRQYNRFHQRSVMKK